MTQNTTLKGIVAKATFLIILFFGTMACNDEKKAEDTKEVAEEHNDAKFDNTSKELGAQFLVNAAEINLEEIQLGQLAQKNCKQKMVSDLGKMMEDNHNAAMNDLIILAGKKQITIPTSATQSAKDTYQELVVKKGMDFDNAYCQLMVVGHTKAVALFEKAAFEIPDVDIKAWATSMLPTLRAHLDHAITCQKACEKLK